MIVNYAIFAVVLLFAGCGKAEPPQNLSAATEFIDSLLVNYDKRLRPNFGGGPVEVGITLYVISISSLSDVDMDFTMDIYFRQFWKDSRLAFDKNQSMEKLSLGHDFGKMIWVPDTFFVNEKESFIHTVTTKNEFIGVDHTGEVKRSIRLSVTASCPMSFQSFPKDTQICSLDMESYGHDASGMKLSWNEPDHSVGIADDLTLNLFELVNHREITQNIELTSANYSRVAVEFEFKRLWMHYVPQVYIPCTMLVILCWITFWLKRNAFNVRLVICTMSLVIMVIGSQVLSSQIPKTAYIKAIDVYTGVCMSFAFAALIAFAFISNQSSQDKKDEEFRVKISGIDRIFQVVFPVTFVAFNLIYCVVY